MLDPIEIDNHQVSIYNIYVTGDLAHSVTKCKLYPKVWPEHGHNISQHWTINALRLVSESNSNGDSVRLGVNFFFHFFQINNFYSYI